MLHLAKLKLIIGSFAVLLVVGCEPVDSVDYENSDDSDLEGRVASSGHTSNNLLPNEQLATNQYLKSADGSHRLYLQSDGNLVLRRMSDSKSLWSSGTNGKSAKRFAFQGDGNLVLYTASNVAVWASNTVGSGATQLHLHSAGQLVLYRNSTVVWSVNGTPPVTDECPNDPNKTEPGLCGCGKPEGTCSGSGQQLTLNPAADAYVDSSATGQNRGTSTHLLIDSSPAVYQTLLRFSVPALTATVSRATLRLYVTNPTGDGPEVYLTSNSWTETGVTYSNRPARQGSIIADLGSVTAGWLEIDVTRAVSAAGTYSFLLTPDSSDGVDFDSREASNKPQLVVITGGGGPVDNCPNDPKKTEPGLCGCGKPEGTCSGTNPWKFVVVGDSRGDNNGVNTSVLAHLVSAIIKEKAEFVLFPGDLTNSGTQTQFGTWIKTIKPLYDAKIGVYAIRGNHDDASLSAWNNAFSGNYRFPQNGPTKEKNLTYSVTHKNVFFVGIDNYSGSAEVNQSWLNTQLAANTQPHVFVFGHEPAFAADHSDTLDDHSSARNAFWQSIKNAGGRAYFCGHDHFYDHARIGDGGSSSDDLHQFIVGTAGAPLYSFNGSYQGSNSNYTPVRQHYEKQYGYVVILIDGRSVEMTFKKRSGSSYVEADWFDYTAQ